VNGDRAAVQEDAAVIGLKPTFLVSINWQRVVPQPMVCVSIPLTLERHLPSAQTKDSQAVTISTGVKILGGLWFGLETLALGHGP
jgi:hypothetical protein